MRKTQKRKSQKRKSQRGGYNAEYTPNQPSVLYSKAIPKTKSKSKSKTHKKHPKRK
jgi:hypothetical protein